MTRLVRWSAPRLVTPVPTAVTLGNFDGVHIGHQAMLAQVKAHTPALGAACAVSFEPTPREFFGPSDAPARLMTLTDKHLALRQLGIELHVSVRFDARIAALSPEAFVRELLCDSLRAKHVVAGHDFRFGRGRTGTVGDLRELGERFGFGVSQVPVVKLDQTIVSSTAVREALAAGQFAVAEALLGRAYTMSGRVVRGQQLGRTLGFATANIRPKRAVLPFDGVLAVTVSDGDTLVEHPAVASLGTRPTVNGRGHLLEVHLFDFQGNLYGRRLTVRFVAKLRDEARFDSLETMTEQMHRDADQARTALAEDARRRGLAV